MSSNNIMNSVYLCLAIGLSVMSTGVDADLRRGNAMDDFAFGRPTSTGARRKRLPGKELRAGSGLLTIEELEKEFEAVSFGDLFFDRFLEESSMSYSMSFSYPASDYSLSYVYSATEKDPLTNDDAPTVDGSPIEGGVPIVDGSPIVGNLPGPSVPEPVPSPDDTTPVVTDLSMNRFTCDAGGEIVLEENTSPGTDTVPVDIEYSYSFESSEDDPNTVFLIEAAIVGTMVSTLLECSATAGADARMLTPASAVSTTFSNVLSTDPCAPSQDGSSSCYIIDSSIQMQLQDGPSADQARIDALTAVKNAIDNEEYVVPTVTSITYLGPEVGDLDSSQVPITSSPDSATSGEAGDGNVMSPMTKAGIALMSIGGVVLVAAVIRRRNLQAQRNNAHVRLKDDGSRDGESSLITIENSQESPASTPTRNGSTCLEQGVV